MADNFFTSNAFLNVLRVVGILVALGLGGISIGIFFISGFELNPFGVLASCYLCFFAILAIIAEIRIVFIIRWFKFLAPFVGFGLYYIFVGLFLVLRGNWLAILGGCVGIGLGVIYVIVGAFGVKRMDLSDEADRKQKDAAVKYAANKAVDTAADNKEALASAAVAENGGKSNPFNNDNPFQGGGNAY